jgi:hypothetical protein
MINGLVEDMKRTEIIIEQIIDCYVNQRFVLVVSERIDHLRVID